jgi:serine/threonine-protein kinase
MAPEQLLHRPLDRRVDVWAIGVSMWELLSGRRLFARDNPGATVTAVLNDPIPEPSYEGSEIPEALRSIVIGAIARDPGARFATARDMEVALEGFIAGSGYSVSSATVEALMRALFQARVEEKTREISLLLQPETSTSGVYPRTGSTDLAAPQRARRPLLVGIAATAVLTLAAVVGAYAAGPAGDEDPAPALAGTSGDADDGAGDAAEESGLDERVSEENGARSAATEPPDDAPAVAEPAATRERPAASARAPDARRRRPDRDQPSQATRPVSITTPGGWADISIDGRAHGRTPARIELPIGRHRIVLLPWGRAPAIRRVVHVRRGSSPRIAIDLRE